MTGLKSILSRLPGEFAMMSDSTVKKSASMPTSAKLSSMYTLKMPILLRQFTDLRMSWILVPGIRV